MTALAIEPFVPFSAVVVAGRASVDITARIVELFDRKVDRTSGPEHHRWTGAISGVSGDRYGSCLVGSYNVNAASLAWVIATRRDVPDDQLPRPFCGESLCVRPGHIALRPRKRPITRRTRNAEAERIKPRTIEELAPPMIRSLAAVDAPIVGVRDIPIDVPTVQPTPWRAIGLYTPQRPARAVPLDYVAFLSRPGIAVVTFTSGSAIVFTPDGHASHATWHGAVERAMAGEYDRR